MKTLLPFFFLLALALASRADELALRVVGLSDASRPADFRRNLGELPEIELVDFNPDKASCNLRFDPAKLIPPGPPKRPVDRSPEKVLAKLNELMRKVSEHTFSFASPSAIPEDQLAKVDINVGLLDCKGCRYFVYSSVAKIDGVERAAVNSETGILTAWIDPAKTNREALEEALIKDQIPLPGNPRSPPAGK